MTTIGGPGSQDDQRRGFMVALALHVPILIALGCALVYALVQGWWLFAALLFIVTVFVGALYVRFYRLAKDRGLTP